VFLAFTSFTKAEMLDMNFDELNFWLERVATSLKKYGRNNGL
jgi:hypothetical protein